MNEALCLPVPEDADIRRKFIICIPELEPDRQKIKHRQKITDIASPDRCSAQLLARFFQLFCLTGKRRDDLIIIKPFSMAGTQDPAKIRHALPFTGKRRAAGLVCMIAEQVIYGHLHIMRRFFRTVLYSNKSVFPVHLILCCQKSYVNIILIKIQAKFPDQHLLVKGQEFFSGGFGYPQNQRKDHQPHQHYFVVLLVLVHQHNHME